MLVIYLIVALSDRWCPTPPRNAPDLDPTSFSVRGNYVANSLLQVNRWLFRNANVPETPVKNRQESGKNYQLNDPLMHTLSVVPAPNDVSQASKHKGWDYYC